MIKNGKMIWCRNALPVDEYIDFACSFEGSKGENYMLDIFCDSDYTVWINGELAAFGQYPGFPDYKVYDSVNVSDFIRDGKNTLCILVWYYGQDFQTYIKDEAGLMFELSENDVPVVWSSNEVLCRPDKGYVRGKGIRVSAQLGFRYEYDNTSEDYWYTKIQFHGFEKAVEVGNPRCELIPRPIKKTILRERIFGKYAMMGTFTYDDYTASAAEAMQCAAVVIDRSVTVDGTVWVKDEHIFRSENTGIWFIVDLGNETCGFLDIELSVPTNCRIDIGYGEHLNDGRCRTKIDIRDFSTVFYASKGKNRYLNTFRRFGCRYVQIFAHTKEIIVNYVGIRPVEYPLNIKKYSSGNVLRDTIYSVCENTLLYCMHEHYEDCPWREQALYTMDSRNQMLCGYYCFEEYEFARASLKLISKGIREDGLLSLCAPAGSTDFPIPSFTLVYFIQMNEYIKYSGDTSLAKECIHILKTIISTFIKRINENGVAGNFYDPDLNTYYWNFYEWAPTMSGNIMNTTEPDIEAPMNAFLSIALGEMAEICSAIGESSEEYIQAKNRLNESIFRHFYSEKEKLFRSFDKMHQQRFSVLTQALCILCGAAEKADKSFMLKVLSENAKGDYDVEIIPNTLSMNCYRFDALIKEDREKYASLILDEIDQTYLTMLREGATSFWETLDGAGTTGSLCHGWSALPIYYYENLL